MLLSSQASLRGAAASCLAVRRLACASPRRPAIAGLATTAADRAHSVAEQVLNAERAAITAQIKELEAKAGSDPVAQKALVKKRIELGYSDPANHVAFAEGKADVTEELFSTMHHKRWRSFLIPRLVKHETQHGIIGDVLPSALLPSVNLEVNFQNTDWLCAYGQPVPPVWTLYSPELTLTTGHAQDAPTRHFTIALIDIDRPDPDTKTYEEWCHWLVTDIPVTNRLVIPGGSSPLLAEPTEQFATMVTGASYVPTAPATPPQIPGNVLLPYVPAHPPASNPRRVHRYVLMVMEQTGGPGSVKVDVEALKEKAREMNARDKLIREKHGTPMWEKSVLGEGEEKLMVRERGLVLPIAKFMKTHELKLKGHGFFTSTWDIHTPAIFSQLGIHEPVYGTLKGATPKHTVHSLTTATALAASLPGPLATLSAQTLKNLNYATPPRPEPAHLLTKRGMEVQNRRTRDAAAAAKKVEKKGGKQEQAVVAANTVMPKTPRVSVLAAAAFVRNKEGDVAKGLKGEYVRAVKEKRYRYENV
ncbi:hypothetical protein PhCBS80983_g05400 [Powellomyces hirtus]|uniref:PEBP-like protein n=1 Tax=Powellomyces hirtus TaxID=109895 RepID=A0A507DUB2_9FUNG|nr:hypothetical protein PhCBS80983_g05400 [Powellomyces hirtus]